MNRYHDNPIITRQDIVSALPELQDVSSVFNPGGIMFHGQILLLLRVQNRARQTLFVRAVSDDGVHFEISDKPVQINNVELCPVPIYHIYDARITAGKDDSYEVLCAMDTSQGCYLGYFVTHDFHSLDFIGIASKPDVRNGVMLSGTDYRFERPNNHRGTDGVKTGSTIVCSKRIGECEWEDIAPVFSGRPHYWDELIGSGPPPIKCKEGWLHLYHGVATHFGSTNIYQAGVSLNDLHQPWQTIARGKYNILEPRELYELCGQVPNVVFPSAAIPLCVDELGYATGEILVYYGAADTSVALASTTVQYLIDNAWAGNKYGDLS